MFEEIDLISYRVHEFNLKKKGGNLIPPKNSFREWDSVTGEVKEEGGVGGSWIDRTHSTSSRYYYIIKITIIYNSHLADIFALSCKSLEDTHAVIKFIKENYEKFFSSDYVKDFRNVNTNVPIKEVLYEITPVEKFADVSDDAMYYITVPILNYVILGGPRPSSKPHSHSEK